MAGRFGQALGRRPRMGTARAEAVPVTLSACVAAT
jgi:hypothetical protein